MRDAWLVLACIVSALIGLLAVVLSRAGLRRALGALVGGLLAAALNVAWDIAAARAGWWHYVAWRSERAPLLLYVPVLFVFGMSFGLIGWRVARRFGARGMALFLLLAVLFGLVRDHVYAARKDLFIWDSLFGSWVIDPVAYLSLFVTDQLAMWVLVGAPKGDSLRGELKLFR